MSWVSCGNTRRGCCLRKPARGESGAPVIDDYGNEDGEANDDPFVVLIEVQRANRLANEDDQECAQRRAQRAPFAADEARTADDRGRDHIQLVTLRVARGRGSIEAR